MPPGSLASTPLTSIFDTDDLYLASPKSASTIKPSYYHPSRASLDTVSTAKPAAFVLGNEHHKSEPQRQTPSRPAKPLSPREEFAKYYGFTLPPLPPQQDDPIATRYPYTHPSPFLLGNDELIAKFNDQFVHSRMQSGLSPKSKSALRKKALSGTGSLLKSNAHASDRQQVFTWVTLSQPSFISRHDHPPHIYPANIQPSTAVVI